MSSNPVIQSIAVSCYRIPTDGPESDGTLEWDHTELVLGRSERRRESRGSAMARLDIPARRNAVAG